MTRPLTPRLPRPWRPRPVLPITALLVLAVALVSSAGAGLRTGEHGARAGHDYGRGPDSGHDRRAPVAAVGHSVSIAGFAYAPQNITVASGDSITWTNQDEAPHTVTTTSGPQAVDSPMLSKGQSFTFTFTAPGTYSYYCTVHPDMRAQVVVTPAPSAPAPPVTTKTSSASASPPPKTTHTSTAVAPHSSTVAGAAPPTTVRPADAPTAHAESSHASRSDAPPSGPPGSTAQQPAEPSAPPPSDDLSSGDPATSAMAAVPASASAGTAKALDPALVLAGLTAGVTVFCLLLLASRRPGKEDQES
ncbi:MAG: hypothetical protein HOV83_06735 [Catenulispora sp.]|nr:hypothetical protein [Catenulispora sp.]